MKNLLPAFLLLFYFQLSGQKITEKQIDISFKTDSTKIRFSSKDIVIPIQLIVNKKPKNSDDINVSIEIDKKNTLLNFNSFEVFYTTTKLKNLKKDNYFFLKIKKDTTNKKDNYTIKLDIKITENDIALSNDGKNKSHNLLIKPKELYTLTGYEYLAYVGTNFDLVEGIQANNLFFGANIFSAPKKTTNSKVGFYLSIYGNRAFSEVDSLNESRITNKLTLETDSTFSVTSIRNILKAKRTVDNLGVLISPLITIKGISAKDPKNSLNLYYAPSLELIYRRTRISTENFSSQPIDSLKNININEIDNLTNISSITPNFNGSREFHEYFLNIAPVGLLMSLENKSISVRTQANVSFSFNYLKNGISILNNVNNTIYDWNLMFSGRTWITEPKTGLTLQADVTNTFKNSKPFFAVTLSKAFDFEKVVTIFKPITTR